MHSKLFVFGHSAGGQFAHRFTFRHPETVIGCEACSSGTWAIGGGYQSITEPATTIPIAIGCGEKDTGQTGPYITALAMQYDAQQSLPPNNFSGSRIEWFKKFETELETKECFYKAKIFPGERHQVPTDKQEELALEAFLLGTSGMLPEEYAEYDADLESIQKTIDAGKNTQADSAIVSLQSKINARSKEPLQSELLATGWHTNDVSLDQCLEAGKEYISEEICYLQKKHSEKPNAFLSHHTSQIEDYTKPLQAIESHPFKLQLPLRNQKTILSRAVHKTSASKKT